MRGKFEFPLENVKSLKSQKRSSSNWRGNFPRQFEEDTKSFNLFLLIMDCIESCSRIRGFSFLYSPNSGTESISGQGDRF